MDERGYGIRATCPECQTSFQVGFPATGPLRAATPEIARQLIEGFGKIGTTTYVFDKSRGIKGRAEIPNDITCPNCNAVHRCRGLKYHVVALEDASGGNSKL